MEQKCPFINAVGKKCPIAIFSYQKCCQRHRCCHRGCEEVIVNFRGSKFCQGHINQNYCQFINCRQLIKSWSVYCEDHTCQKCVNPIVEGTMYCLQHQPKDFCVYINDHGHVCHRPVKEHDNLCRQHVCHFWDRDPMGSSCNQSIQNDHSKYCAEHGSHCSFDNCQNECQEDEEACDIHRCQEIRCANKYITSVPEKLCQYHYDVYEFLLHEFS